MNEPVHCAKHVSSENFGHVSDTADPESKKVSGR